MKTLESTFFFGGQFRHSAGEGRNRKPARAALNGKVFHEDRAQNCAPFRELAGSLAHATGSTSGEKPVTYGGGY